MQNLGDFFPEDIRKDLARKNLGVGSVLRFQVDFTTPPKIKRMVVVGFDYEKVVLAVVLINSEINPSYFPTPEARAMHLELNPVGRDFLDHTSFVDCSELFPCTIDSIYALRCSFAHNYSLSNIGKGKKKIILTQRFIVHANPEGSIVSLRFKQWDGNYVGRTPHHITYINLLLLGNLVEDICKTLVAFVNSDNLEIVLPGGCDELIGRFSVSSRI